MKHRPWKAARINVQTQLGLYNFARPSSFGPAGRSKRYFTFLGGIDDHTITAPSEEVYWERLWRYVQTLDHTYIDLCIAQYEADIENLERGYEPEWMKGPVVG